MLAKRWKILCLLIGLASGCTRVRAPSQEPRAAVTPAPSPTTKKPEPVRPFPQDLIFRTVKKSTEQFSGLSGIVVEPLESAPNSRVEHKPDASFEAASLVKLPILVELAKRFQEGSSKREDTLVFEERHRVGGSGLLKDRPAGQSYSLQQLAEWMIAESDNVATDMLLEYLKMDSIESHMRELGLKQTTVQRKVFAFEEIEQGRDNRISAGDAARLMAMIGRGEVPEHQWMLQILQKTRRRDLIQGQLPKGLKVAHKTGELTGFLHDAAIIYTSRPYVLVVLTQAPAAESQAFIQSVSRDIYGLMEEIPPE